MAKTKPKLTLPNKKILAGAVVGVLIVAVTGVFIVTRWGNFGTSEEQPPEKTVSEVGLNAATLVEEGKTEEALQSYDSQVEAAKDNEAKKILLVMKSRTAQSVGQGDAAVAAAKQADELGSDGMTIRALAEAHVANGDKEQAISQYKRLLEMYSPDDDGLRRGPTVQEIIEELER